MVGFEEACQKRRPDCVLVVGDVNSTLACSIVAKKLCIPVAHVEAGLRSGDMTMPEEVNRIVTDAIADFLFVTEPSGVRNLLNRGKPAARNSPCRHVMVTICCTSVTRLALTDTSLSSPRMKLRLRTYGAGNSAPPSNVDTRDALERIRRPVAK